MDIVLREEDFLLIVNPAAGRGRGAKTMRKVNGFLENIDLNPKYLVSSGPGDVYLKAKEAALLGVRRVIVIGGDGTLQEAASGIAGTGIELGIIPAGSGNDFIKTFGIPKDTHQALRVALWGQAKPIDMGLIGDRYFVNMVGIGFDALVAAENLRLKHVRGFTGYLYALAKVFLHYQAPHVKIEAEGFSFEGRILLAAFGNGICCGGGFYLTPDASPCDGKLDVCIIRDMPRTEMIRDIGKVFKGTHTELDPVMMNHCSKLDIESDIPLPIHADGEVLPLGTRKVSIEVFPKLLRVVTPAEDQDSGEQPS